MPTGIYVRVKPVWNKGLTKDTDARIAKQPNLAIGRPHPMKPYEHTEKQKEASRQNFRKYNDSDSSPWNRGLTKEDHPGIARGAEAARQYMSGRCLPEKTRKQMSLSSPYRGKPCSEEKKQNLREKNKRQVPWNKGLDKNR